MGENEWGKVGGEKSPCAEGKVESPGNVAESLLSMVGVAETVNFYTGFFQARLRIFYF